MAKTLRWTPPGAARREGATEPKPIPWRRIYGKGGAGVLALCETCGKASYVEGVEGVCLTEGRRRRFRNVPAEERDASGLYWVGRRRVPFPPAVDGRARAAGE